MFKLRKHCIDTLRVPSDVSYDRVLLLRRCFSHFHLEALSSSRNI